MKILYSRSNYDNVSWVISNMAVTTMLSRLQTEEIWKNYIDIQQKNMQVRFIMIYMGIDIILY